jgi:hypothetical protein
MNVLLVADTAIIATRLYPSSRLDRPTGEFTEIPDTDWELANAPLKNGALA